LLYIQQKKYKIIYFNYLTKIIINYIILKIENSLNINTKSKTMKEDVSISVILFILGVITLLVVTILVLDKISERVKEYYLSIEWEWVMILIFASVYVTGWIITRPLHRPYEYVKGLFKSLFLGVEVTVQGKVISINPGKVDVPDVVDNGTFITPSHEVPIFVLKVVESVSNEEIIINIYANEKMLGRESIQVGCSYKFTCIKHWGYGDLIFSSKNLY